MEYFLDGSSEWYDRAVKKHGLAIKIEGLVKEFGGVRAVDGLTLEVPKGKITGLIGPNGSGKTTVANVLTGLYPIDGGSVTIGNSERKKLKPYQVLKLGITRTFQGVRLFEQVSVFDNVMVVITQRSVWGALFEKHKAEHREKARRVLERVGLWGKRDAKAAELSYGQRKLLEIARAMATDAEVVLFDEPYAGLFPEMVKLVRGLMEELRDEGKTIVLVEHDMALIRELCDHVVVMDAGKLLAEGTAAEVLADRRVIEAYLGA